MTDVNTRCASLCPGLMAAAREDKSKSSSPGLCPRGHTACTWGRRTLGTPHPHELLAALFPGPREAITPASPQNKVTRVFTARISPATLCFVFPVARGLYGAGMANVTTNDKDPAATSMNTTQTHQAGSAASSLTLTTSLPRRHICPRFQRQGCGSRVPREGKGHLSSCKRPSWVCGTSHSPPQAHFS